MRAADLDRCSHLWVAATEWLSYRDPGEDETKSRWDVASEWEAIRRSAIAETPCGMTRVYEGLRRGKFEKVVPNLTGYLVSYAAIFGFDSFEETCGELLRVVPEYCSSRDLSFEKRVRARRRQFGLP